MSDVYDKIRSALDTRLKAMGDALPSIENKPVIAWENVTFTPPDGSAWVRAHFGTSASQRKTAGDTGYSRIDGMYEVVIMWPLGDGAGGPVRLADKIIQQFKSGTRLSAGDVTITVSAAWKAPGYSDGGWFNVPVTVAWYTHQNEV